MVVFIIIICIIILLTELVLLFEGKWELDLSKSKDMLLAIFFAIHFCFMVASLFTTLYNFKK